MHALGLGNSCTLHLQYYTHIAVCKFFANQTQVSCIAVIVPGALSTIKIDSATPVKEGIRSLGKAVCAIVIVAGVLGTALELLTIILRFINIGFVNMRIKYFLLAVS